MMCLECRIFRGRWTFGSFDVTHCGTRIHFRQVNCQRTWDTNMLTLWSESAVKMRVRLTVRFQEAGTDADVR